MADDAGIDDDFSAWVAPHWEAMVKTVSRLTSSNDRDDVLQEALSVAWRKRSSYDPSRGSIKTWLLLIAVDQARKSWRRARVFAPLSDQVPVDVSDQELRLDLERALGGLPPRQRLAVALHYYVGLPLSEVAVVMGCAEGTVKSTLSDARARLRGLLGTTYR